MATKKPRVNVALEPETFELVRKAAEAQGVSMSELVRSMVDAVVPMLGRMVDLAEALKGAPQEIRDALREAGERAEGEILPALHSAEGDFEKLLSFAEELGAQAREAGADPRPVITGVTHE